VLHLEVAMAAERDDRAEAFRAHTDLASSIFLATERSTRHAPSALAHRTALAAGLVLLIQRNLISAEQYLGETLKRRPDDVGLLLAYGTVLETRAASRDAYSAQSRMTGAGLPPRAGGLVRDDLFTRERGARRSMLHDAAKALERTLAIDASVTEARIRLARVRALEGDRHQATVLLEQALAAQPSPSWEYVSRLMLGDIQAQEGNLDVARQLYERAIVLYPSGQSAYLALSEVIAAGGDADAASQVLERLFDRQLVANDAHDPWWDYPIGQRSAAAATLARLRALLSQ
jgi:tetratricopeptide (TPR) repeat protein